MKSWIRAGLLAGIGVGLFLRIIETWTDAKVYTLLLNVDFVPWLNQFRLPEFVEFLFHLIVSLLLAWILWEIITRRNWTGPQKALFTVTASLLVGVVLYPLTLLSSSTPELFDVTAILWWMLGHLLYGLLLLVEPGYRSS